MEKYDIKSFHHQDENWFVSEVGCKIYAYRKGYLVKFGKGKQIRGRYGTRVKTKVQCADGGQCVIHSNTTTIAALRKWVKSKHK